MKKILKGLLVFSMIIEMGGCKKEEPIQKESHSEILRQTKKEENVKYVNHYYYDQYNEEEKKAYDDIYKCMIECKEIVETTSTIDEDTLKEIYTQVLYDHPEIYYITYSINLNDQGNIIIDYYYTPEQINAYNQEISVIQREYLKAIEGMDVVEIFDYTYSFMFPRISYDHDAFESEDFDPITYHEDYNIIKALTEGLCVCAGYATTFQYLINTAGYQCLLVQGASSGGDHAWDVVILNEEFYYFDPTWDDNERGYPMSYYRYYGNSYAQISQNHFFKNNVFTEATSTDLNYADIHGYALEDVYDVERVINLQKENEMIMLKCRDQKDYNYIKQQVDNGMIQNVDFQAYVPYDQWNTVYLLK